jgi:hypothetical protein
MNGETWTQYALQPPSRDLLCQFRRHADQGPAGWFVAYARDFRPEFNISGLEWRLTGIAREELDRMPKTTYFTAMLPGQSSGWGCPVAGFLGQMFS